MAEDFDLFDYFDAESEENDEIKPLLSEDDVLTKYSNGQLRIVRTTMDFSLHNLKQVLGDTSYLNLSPSYQRRNRWDLKKKSLLIESFLMNIPVPPIFLYEKDYNSYEVMDGLQRLQTINNYLDDQFPLKYLEFWDELNGKKFSELPTVLQRGLLRRTISAIVLLAESTRPEDSEVDIRLVLFKRLNTGGIQLNPQEIRNAIYPSKFNDMLIKVARSDLFTKIWGIPPKVDNEEIDPPQELLKNNLYRTMADCELVLRFFAIRDTIQYNLKGSLRKLLDTCMIRHLYDNDQKINELESLFLNNLHTLYEIFDKKPFILPQINRISAPLYDALMVAISFIDDKSKLKSKEEIKSSLSDYLNDPKTYEVLTGKGNTNSAIRDRVFLANKILVGM